MISRYAELIKGPLGGTRYGPLPTPLPDVVWIDDLPEHDNELDNLADGRQPRGVEWVKVPYQLIGLHERPDPEVAQSVEQVPLYRYAPSLAA